MAGSLVYSQRVRHHKTHPPSIIWQNKITSLAGRLHIKRAVKLLESEIVKIPVVIGHLKPIIFIPLGLLNSLPAGEIEAVLLHELAHIRRNDYFINLIQVIAENIFFFNPALLWISSLLREERENCCDDVALAQTKSKKQFIQALISFKEHALHTTSYTTAFPAKKNQLLQRVTRIAHNKNKTLSGAEKVFFLSSFLLLAVLSFVITNGQGTLTAAQNEKNIQVAPTGTPGTTAQAKAPEKITADSKEYYFIKDAHARDASVDKSPAAAKPGQKQKPAVIEVYKKSITGDGTEAQELNEKELAKKTGEPLTDAQQVELDKQQAIEDEKQAVLDRAQAEQDRIEAIKDMEQAKKDQAQAELDRKQAELDRQEAVKEKAKAMKDRAAAVQPVKHH
jgi:hypothetical protein